MNKYLLEQRMYKTQNALKKELQITDEARHQLMDNFLRMKIVLPPDVVSHFF